MNLVLYTHFRFNLIDFIKHLRETELGMSLIEFEGKKPEIDDSVFLAPGSWIIGDVVLKERVSVWTGAIIRGDDSKVVIGSKTAVLENCVVEAPSESPVEIGEATLVSHGAIVHGSRIGNRVLIGVGAIVLDGATIGDRAIIGAGALVPPQKVVLSNKLLLGVPARMIREVRDEDAQTLWKEHERILHKAEIYRAQYCSKENF